MHFKRLGCFSIEFTQRNSLEIPSSLEETYQEGFHPVQACAAKAWSRGLKLFAVHDGGRCLGGGNLSTSLRGLNISGNCLGGRGAPNASDVYRFTSKNS